MSTTITERARRYVASMPPSIQGRSGSTALFNVAVALVKGFQIDEVGALEILSEWNQAHALPPWGEKDLQAKIRNARIASKPDGYLLGSQSAPRPSTAPMPRPAPAALSYSPDDLARRETLRAGWPKRRKLSLASMEEIARLRLLPVEGVFAAVSLGYLSGAYVADHAGTHRCFVIHDGLMAQARRFDGMPFTFADKTTAKNKTLPGSLAGGFLGKSHLGDADCNILLVEGVIGLIEGLSAVCLAPEPLGLPWCVLAAVTAGSAFRNDKELLSMMAGRRVRIVMDGDAAGAEAAGKWTAELRAAGAVVDAVRLPKPSKDLGEIIALGGDALVETLTTIFTL